jgi:type IV pilus assembly protein PilA
MQLVRERLASGDREAGFTLIELLIVMLVMALLASIAMPAFLNQKVKANDAKAKQMTHAAQVAMETCNVNSAGTYSTTACNLAGLRAIEPTIPASGVVVEPNVPSGGYTIKVTATSGNVYIVKREGTGAVVFKCTVASAGNRGGCPGSDTAEGTWGT